jgi:phosphoglycerate kinase
VTLRTLDQLGDVAGRRVFLRADLNVPVSGTAVTDDSRIVATVPTIRELLERGATLVIASHLGRPKGRRSDDLRLAPVGVRLAELLGRDIVTLGEPAPDALPDAPVDSRSSPTPMWTTPSVRCIGRTRACRRSPT